MRHLAMFFIAGSLVLLGCQAEDQAAAPSASSPAAESAAVESSPPAPTTVVEETVVEAAVVEPEALPEGRDVSINPRLSGPAADLSEALTAGDSDRIVDSIALLEERGGPGSIIAISMVIERSDDPELKIEAIDSLAFLADEGDVSGGLETALEDPSPDVRIEAADVIVELELTELLPVLHTRSYQESDPDVREVIEDAIFELEPVDQDERG